MFELYSKNSLNIIIKAQEIARNFGHNFVGPEHLLFGITQAKESKITKILDKYGIKSDDIKKYIEDIYGDMGGDSIEQPFLPHAKNILFNALHIAKYNNTLTEPEHLLLALIIENCAVNTFFYIHDVNPELIKQDILLNTGIKLDETMLSLEKEKEEKTPYTNKQSFGIFNFIKNIFKRENKLETNKISKDL